MNTVVLDGGFSTQLSNYVGDIIDGDPLWSARFLATNPEAVQQAHFDFLNAGAEIIITNSYQASVSGFMKYLNLDKASAYSLIKESVRIAKRAVETYMKANPNAKKPLIAGSVGPYGASLHDGSEYTGQYVERVRKETIMAWHRARFNALIEEGVDLLAIETIPARAEAEALIELLKEYPNQKAWLAFQCKDPEHTAHGENFAEVARTCWALGKEQLVAIGVNCLNPNYVCDLLKNVNQGVIHSIPLIVYPNSGEEYSPDDGWSGKDKCVNLMEFVNDWLNLGVKYIGGCCRTDANDVLSIKKAVKKWILEHK